MTFERNLSGQFSPLAAPFLLHDPPAPRSTPAPWFSRTRPFTAPIPLRSHALLKIDCSF